MNHRPNDIADEIVARKLAASDYPLSADMHDDSLVEALLGVGVRPRNWKGHPLYARDRAIAIREAAKDAAERKARLRDRRASVAVSLAIGAGTILLLVPSPAEAGTFPDWLWQPAISPARGIIALLLAALAGVVMAVRPSRQSDPDPVNDNRPSLEERAREWEGQQ